jgi:hypothetical protein
VVGELGEDVIVRVRRLASTELVRFPLGSADPQLVASSSGAQQAAVFRSALYWTAVSAEALGTGLRSLHRLTGSSSSSEALTDWLPGDGALLSTENELYYAADQLYAMPRSLALATPMREIPAGRAETDGRTLVLLNDTAGPAPLAAVTE